MNWIFSFPTIKYNTHLSLALSEEENSGPSLPVNQISKTKLNGGTAYQTFDLVLVLGSALVYLNLHKSLKTDIVRGYQEISKHYQDLIPLLASWLVLLFGAEQKVKQNKTKQKVSKSIMELGQWKSLDLALFFPPAKCCGIKTCLPICIANQLSGF